MAHLRAKGLPRGSDSLKAFPPSLFQFGVITTRPAVSNPTLNFTRPFGGPCLEPPQLQTLNASSPSCPPADDLTWPTLFPDFCNDSRQSPIDIVSSAATPNANLTAFTFTNFDNTSMLDKIENTGLTGECWGPRAAPPPTGTG